MTLDDVFLGMRVATSHHREADLSIIKRINSDFDEVFLVGLDGAVTGWVSIGSVLRPSQYQLNRNIQNA